ncbi:MAG: dehydrogenase, partial [Methylophaga sp.]
FHTAAVVQGINRDASGVTIRFNGEAQRFDKVVIATHSDHALRLLDKPSKAEIEILGAIGYQQNDMLLHSDKQVLPRKKTAWASWNVRVCPELANQCTVNYHMNTLQGIDAPLEFIVSLNSNHLVDPAKVFLGRRYAHPIYNAATLAAQKRWDELAGDQHTFYCGAYWGWGFHEDGVNSALRVIETLQQQTQDVSNVA